MRTRHRRQIESAVYRYGLWETFCAAVEGWIMGWG